MHDPAAADAQFEAFRERIQRGEFPSPLDGWSPCDAPCNECREDLKLRIEELLTATVKQGRGPTVLDFVRDRQICRWLADDDFRELLAAEAAPPRKTCFGRLWRTEQMGMDVYGKNPSKECGAYFRACIWSWRPIHQQMEALCRDLLSEDLLESMAYNDGAGPDDQETCTEMASRFSTALDGQPDGFTSESSLRVDASGAFLSAEVLSRNPEVETFSPYVADLEMVTRWIEFLRHCGGLSVY